MARDALIQLALEHDDLIPLIWQMSDPASPGADDRFQFYGGETFPTGIFGGNLSYIGEDEAVTQYADFYDQLTGMETPWDIDLHFGFDTDNNYRITADISLEDSVATDSINVIFALTQHDLSNYSSLVLNSFNDTLSISESGDSISLQKLFPDSGYYELTSLRAVVIVQDMRTREILQSAQTGITQLIPEVLVNINSGPASLGVYFQNASFPVENITMWQWDFQNDGIIDSNEENPYWVFEQPGVYDVKLMISDGESRAEKLFTELITVLDTDAVEGTVLGVWSPQFNPYHIVNDISIPYYGELVIEPGTEIVVDYNKKINVYGRIDIAGSAEEPVILTSDSTWKGIKLLNSLLDNRIEYAHITNTNLSAVNASYASIEILNSVFYGNVSGSLGAAINLLGCEDVLIHGNMIINNSSSMTGGIALRSSYPIISNNIIANNDGSMAGALVIRESSEPLIMNNIIAYNDAPIAAIFVDESTPGFFNNILLDQEDVFLGDLSAMRLDYNLSSQTLPGDSNFYADPLFMSPSPVSGTEYDALLSDWHLQPDSPAIDAGDPAEEYNDLEDSQNPGYALYPALGTIRNDLGFYGGPGIIPEVVPADEDDIVSPADITLISYPNPFVPSSSRNQLIFSIEGADGGELKIFNLKGQKIASLEIAQRSNTTTWNGKNRQGRSVSSGIYFARWQNENRTATKKLIILD
ncbi:MAG: T9SS type A sorting domain-containing protein [Candidatus Cloacimonetes bacterium]|nr:T9SS type A sorting domain-containing protein [Candidatus Cloacimonadota bacterium]